MEISDKKLEKLKKKLLNDDIGWDFYEDYSEGGRIISYRGFEIIDKERKVKKRKPPLMEYFCTIRKVPCDDFNHLLNKGLRIEYPPFSSKIFQIKQNETEKKLQDETFVKLLDIITNEVIKFIQDLKYTRAPSIQRSKETDKHIPGLNKQKIENKCPQCNQILGDFALKCKECGEWLNHEVFDRLCKVDIEIIKSKDLKIVTPSMICLIILEPMQTALRDTILTKEGSLLRRFLFKTYCYASALDFVAQKKSGSEDSLRFEIYKALIKQALSLFEELAQKRKFEKDLTQYGLYIFKRLDEIIDPETPYNLDNPEAAGFLIAQDLGEVIFEEKNNLNDNIELFTEYYLSFEHHREIFSELFIVEEEDFAWDE